MNGYAVCHGEPDYHHILIGNGYTAVTEFNQMHLGVQMEDLYYFLRKIMENMTGMSAWGDRSWRRMSACCRSRSWNGRCFTICSGIRRNTGSRSILLQCQQGLGACEEHGEDQKLEAQQKMREKFIRFFS